MATYVRRDRQHLPNVTGQIELCRAQLATLSNVDMTYSMPHFNNVSDDK